MSYWAGSFLKAAEDLTVTALIWSECLRFWGSKKEAGHSWSVGLMCEGEPITWCWFACAVAGELVISGTSAMYSEKFSASQSEKAEGRETAENLFSEVW